MRYLGILALSFAIPLLAAPPESRLYFPGQNNPDSSNRYAASERGTADRLAQVEEPSLCCSQQGERRQFRFTWFRTFDHPVVIRLDERGDGKWNLIVKVVSGESGYDFENLKLIHNETRIVGALEVQSLLKNFDVGAEFWRLQAYIDDGGLDGATWLIEARSKDQYRYVSRWSPESGAIREIGLQFLGVSGLKIERVY